MINKRKDGRLYSHTASISPVTDTSGAIGHFVAVSEDVTARRDLEARLVTSDRLASLGLLAAEVAHELNSPLAFVLSNLELLAMRLSNHPPHQDPLLLDELCHMVRDAADGAQRMAAITRDLKALSRSGTESLGPIDARRAFESALRLCRTSLVRTHLTHSFEAVPFVQGSEARLVQVLINLLGNAAQSFEENSNRRELAARLRRANDRVLLEVSDTGRGIPADILPNIFDPFFTTKQEGVGTGLGLYIAKKLVGDMGGTLTVESAVGEGSTFRIALPVWSWR